MMQKDPKEIKNRIVQLLNSKGAMLPVYISKEIGMESLFTSAFLSELVSERRIKVSHMRVGSSPIYFTDEKIEDLEKFGTSLGSREKEAFLNLKEKRFLDDEEQEPAIRVALRSIKDFAIPFSANEKTIWRYFLVQESEFNKKLEESKTEIKEEKIPFKEENKDLHESTLRQGKVSEKSKKKIKAKPKNNNFFEKIKEFLSKKDIEIIGIESVSAKELVLKIKENETQKILIAFNKKKITENDFIKASKKAKETGFQYSILALEEPSKKIANFINALKGLAEVESLNKNI